MCIRLKLTQRMRRSLGALVLPPAASEMLLVAEADRLKRWTVKSSAPVSCVCAFGNGSNLEAFFSLLGEGRGRAAVRCKTL